jgi:hypothetical protein
MASSYGQNSQIHVCVRVDKIGLETLTGRHDPGKAAVEQLSQRPLVNAARRADGHDLCLLDPTIPFVQQVYIGTAADNLQNRPSPWQGGSEGEPPGSLD